MSSKKLRNLVLAAAAVPAALLALAPTLNGSRDLASVAAFKNWGLSNEVGQSHVHALDAWKIEKGSKNIVVAVVDTGIDANHPDLRGNLWRDPVTGAYGYDFVTNKPNPGDEHGHGTHVAGILGATLNARAGISGVAPNVSIMGVRYYSEKISGAENLKNSIKALNWAIDHGANIINYSGGGPERSEEEFQAIKRAQSKGILVVAAAGNERQNTDNPENFYYPCAYRLENIVCVSSVNIRGDILSSSNWGKHMVDVAAPGENILSTVPGGKYAYMTGTSQATAFVTGLAALMLSHDHSLKPSDIREIIRETADKLPKLADKVMSGGTVNAGAALARVERRMGSGTRTIARKDSRPALRLISDIKKHNFF